MFLLMGSHLFDPLFLLPYKKEPIVMIEDYGLCTHFSYHKQKLVFFLESMRNHRDLLKKNGFKVIYVELNINVKPIDFMRHLLVVIKDIKTTEMKTFTIEDKFFRENLEKFCIKNKIVWNIIKTPLFINDELEIKQSLGKKPLLRNFYEKERLKRKILLTKSGTPKGGKFSFDKENRLKLPKDSVIPNSPAFSQSKYRDEIVKIVNHYFSHHPGALTPWLPSTRVQAKEALKLFIDERLINFGPYEDAIDSRHPFLFHSLLSPLLNAGLLTPQEVIDEALKHEDKIPLNSLEGFVRQIIGWREFVRGIYEKFSKKEEEGNFFNHHRKLTKAWYMGSTGIVPLDHSIKKAWDYGYCHHIERLMVLSNLMLLSEIAPSEVYRWFMEMFVDSADWVMGPNVFGMGQFSDGGLFTTKPYICGSNYLLKMSSFKKGDWCDTVDGLYWRFIHKHEGFFKAQPRLSMMPKMLERMDPHRKKHLFLKADAFIENYTTCLED